MKQIPEQSYCFLLDEQGRTLVRGALLDPPGARYLRVRLLESPDGIDLYRRKVHLVGMDDQSETVLCRVNEQRGAMLALERLRVFDGNLRQNIRVPICFSAPTYPLSGAWRGRRWVSTLDLSCGGVAFYAPARLDVGEQLEMVIPITAQPLVLRCQVLRARVDPPNRLFYAAKFIDFCHDEEAMVRQAVFSTQLKQRAPETR